MLLFELFYTFLLIGIFTFGGGYSMVALIEDEVVFHHGWLSAQEFTDILAISQMTPGPIGINTATYTGYTAMINSGQPEALAIFGALVASLAVVLLPVALMLLVTVYLQHHMGNPMVAQVFRVLRMAVVGLIAAAALTLLTAESFGTPFWQLSSDAATAQCIQWPVSVAIFAAVFFLSWRHKLGPIALILISAATGVLIYSIV